jgi:hypothetical protein
VHVDFALGATQITRPSDATAERPVRDAIVLTARPRSASP